jgi:N-acetylglucosaminyl-diphospho-decaprenol L-rhamnosyltransferase
MPAVDISVIIVTFNSAGCIAACVESVLAQADVSFEIIVVDNASVDDTLARLKNFPCRVIPGGENLGFGRGNNLGFASSSGRYIYLLNPDARLVAKNSLAKLCRHMDANGRWGMAGTLIRSAAGQAESAPATEYPGARHVHRDFSKLPGKIAWIMGASMIIRRELYGKLGGFDPGFFLYSEETDFCLRLREMGYEIGHVGDVAVSHIGGASEDRRDPYDVSARKLKGLLRFRQKHYPPEDCVFLARRDLRRARWRMFWNGLLARVQPARSQAWQKRRQYRAIWEVTREHLLSAERK